jgi:hypothetical protein
MALERFVPGQVYFTVMFHDEDLQVPVVQTLIFVEERQRDDGSAFLLFRQIPPQGEESKFIVDRKDERKLLLDRSELIDKLKDCFDGKLATPPRRKR